MGAEDGRVARDPVVVGRRLPIDEGQRSREVEAMITATPLA